MMKNKMRDRLKGNFEKVVQSGGNKDSRLWAEDFKASGNYQIRFVCDEDFNTVVKYKEHTVKYIDSRGIEKSEYFICPKINGDDCPVCDKMKKLWDDEKNGLMTKDQVKDFINNKMPTKTRVVTNIKILKDEKRPENVGNVYLFRVNGYVEKDIEAQMKDKGEVADPEFIEAIPFDPIKAPIYYLQYTIPASKGEFPKWTGSKFLKTLTTIKGEKITVDTTESELEELEEANLEYVKSKTYNLNGYLDEIKKKAPTFEEISSKVSQYIYGASSASRYVDKKELVNDEILNDEIEEEDVIVEVKPPEPKKEIKNIKPTAEVKTAKQEEIDESIISDEDDEDDLILSLD